MKKDKANKKKKGEKKAAEQQTGEKKAGKKKFLLIGLVVAIAAAAGAYFFVIKGDAPSGKKGKLPDAVEAYTLGEESVASITAAVEEASDEVLLSVSTNAVSESDEEEKDEDKDEEETDETEDKKEKKEKDKEDKEDKEEEKEDTKEEKDTDAAAVPEGETEWYYYCYRLTPESPDYLQQYKEFLQEEGFEPVKNAADFKQPVSQYAEAYQRKCANEEQLFVIELECPLKGDEVTGIYSIKVRLEEQKTVTPVTREDTLNYFKTLSQELLGLEKPISDYSVMMDMGRTFVDGKECYGISLYEKGQDDESYFVKKFYLSLAEKKLYEYMGGDIIGMQQNTSVSGNAEESASEGDASNAVHEWNFGPIE